MCEGLQADHESRFSPIDDHAIGVDRTCATLCIHSNAITAAEITRMLDLQPTSVAQARVAGESRFAARPHGWFLSSEAHVSSKDIRTHLDWLVSVVKPKMAELFDLQKQPGVKMLVRCPWWTNGDDGPALWPEQMTNLGALNLECAFDFKDYSDRS